MKKIINRKMLDMVAESQEFGINDRLSKVLEKQEDYTGELSENELSLVSAASGTDYETFIKMMKKRDN